MGRLIDISAPDRRRLLKRRVQDLGEALVVLFVVPLTPAAATLAVALVLSLKPDVAFMASLVAALLFTALVLLRWRRRIH